MILKGSQRAGASQLANHLLNANDNDHVTVHEVSGFMADDVYGAFREIEAVSQGTQCQQYMFSLSLNPPPSVEVSTQRYEETVTRIEKELNLDGQPRVIVFHEKENRIHAHAVWSRIDAQTMKAIPMSFFKNKLMEISRDIYLENDWPLPKGFMDHEKRDPLRYSLEEYQQAKRMDQNPKLVKRVLKTCWEQSDNRDSFEVALKRQGFFLARGARRGFLAVSMTGGPLSLSRWLNAKAKDLKARLGDPKSLPSVSEMLEKIELNKSKRYNALQAELNQQKAERLKPLLQKRRDLITKQRAERQALKEKHDLRQQRELTMRQARFRSGLRGLWDRVTGTHKKLSLENERSYQQSLQRDAREWDQTKQRQLKARSQIVSRTQVTKAELQKQRAAMFVLKGGQRAAIAQHPSKEAVKLRVDRSR